MVRHAIGWGRRKGPVNVLIPSAGEKEPDGEFGVVDPGDQLHELRNEVVIVALIQCIDDYEPYRTIASRQCQDGIDQQSLKLVCKISIQETRIFDQRILDRFLSLWDRGRELEGEGREYPSTLALVGVSEEEIASGK